MTATVQQELTDTQRAALARSHALATLPPEVARAVVRSIEDGLTLPGLVDRGRWRTLMAEVMRLNAPGDDTDYLVISTRAETCVWCHTVVPAGNPLELIVAHGDQRWWACEPCAHETRTPTAERNAA